MNKAKAVERLNAAREHIRLAMLEVPLGNELDMPTRDLLAAVRLIDLAREGWAKDAKQEAA